MDQYGYRDVFRTLKPGAREFTFALAGTGNYRARLDRMYIHESRCQMIKSAEIYPIPFSDHDLFVIDLITDFPDERPIWGRGLWKLNSSLLENPETMDRIETEWLSWREQKPVFNEQLSWWEYGKRFMKSLFIEIGKKQKRETKDRKLELMKELKMAAKQTGLDSAMKIRHLKGKILKIEEDELAGAAVRSRSDWNQKGEKCTRYFFDLEKKNGTQKIIKQLEMNGRLLTDKTEILEGIYEHFKSHFKADTINQEACSQLVRTITKRISPDDSKNLERPFTLDELEASHRKMKLRKSPGNDGLSYEFYKATWPFIKYDLLDTINEIFTRKELPISMTQSVSTLI